MSSPRILTLDIETLPVEAYVWGIWDVNVNLDMIKTDWTIASYCAKWLGSKELIYADTGGRGTGKVRDDGNLLAQLWRLLNEADIVVAQNGIKFDIKKINARLIGAGWPPYAPVRVVDTLVAARKHFGFTSNKLAFTSELLTNTPKSSHKRFPGFELWKECLADNPKAWAEMKKYNCRDVIATEKLYKALRPWISNHPNMGAYTATTKEHACPKCGSDKTQKRGIAVTQQGSYHRYQCLSCSGWSRGKERVMPIKDQRKLLA